MTHQHNFSVSQCEEGCGCNYLFISCDDADCEIQMDIAQGWDGCNIDWTYWLREDVEHLKKIAPPSWYEDVS